MRFALLETRIGLRNSITRLPFRYGNACLTACPQAILQVRIDVGGRVVTGYSGDCLPPGWFDKSPARSYPQQIADMLAVLQQGERCFREAFNRPAPFFPAWLAATRAVYAWAGERQLPDLLAGFGASMVERALLDAMCRAADLSFARAVRENLFGLQPAVLHPVLGNLQPAEWLPERPSNFVFVRHTVGLSDPLTVGEIAAADRLHDGFPQALEEYVRECRLRYFKVKVSNQLDRDLARLRTVAAVVERQAGSLYYVTLDGNEQYRSSEEVLQLVSAIRQDEHLKLLWQNTLFIEQPLERKLALLPQHAPGIWELSQYKPVIIDESDGTFDAFPQAVKHGYRGVSSKSCKGPIKSLLNAGMVWILNDRGRQPRFLLSGEDLCTVGIVPVQADLSLVATLGLEHVERNGHHYHPGLSYLPESQQQAALAAHPDLYTFRAGRIAPRVADGRLALESLHCAGFGFAVEPDMSGTLAPEEWDERQLPSA